MPTLDSPAMGPSGSSSRWYLDAIIYEVHVRAFADSNGDGIGDFLGLTGKLGYLQDLGVTALWLLPFYPSPLRDGGYDISDYVGVHPDYGSSADFLHFLEEAHRRDLKVITELVINHTSSDHAWFQRARRAPPGSPERDFYVWSDTPDRYAAARVIFKDFENSNWAWDPLAHAYYWHRFYGHQPDLNFDNPAVHEAILGVLDHWMKLGVDGVRLDAVPYLYEREGTTCENLPETHAFLKTLRAHVDARYQDRMLLAEANQWPADAAAYFGTGDECHMNFNFPLMPRLFMAVNLEDSFPVVDILQQTPPIPEGCQWATFLRNHDELTLEMVTEEDRDYMYRVYASEHRARLNLGIRRRLAPLLGDRRRQELLNALLFSLPGTPVLYYGDEIGMGDNIYLGDRDGVRTPMQWNSDRNGGFSRANPQRLYLPLVVDPHFHFEAVNVEAQQANPSSLLWWTKHLISLRRQSSLLSQGQLAFLDTGNAKVLAFVREHHGERMLFVANLSRFPQYAPLLVADYQGAVPVEVLGRSRFPRLESPHWGVTLGPYDYLWFSLETPEVAEARSRTPLRAAKDWWRVAETAGAELAARLADSIARRRWFRSKGLARTGQELVDVIRIQADGEHFLVVLLRVDFSRSESETCVLPLAWAGGSKAKELAASNASAVVTPLHVVGDDGAVEEGALLDALAASPFPARLLKALVASEEFPGALGALRFTALPGLQEALASGQAAPRLAELDQTNSVVFYGSQAVLKLLRVIDPGPNAEEEMTRTLNARAPRRLTPSLLGTVSWQAPGSERALVGLLTAMVANRGTAWSLLTDAVQSYLERAATQEGAAPDAPVLLGPEPAPLPPAWGALVDPLPALVELLARRTAELHLVLAGEGGGPGFDAEPFDLLHQQSLYQKARALTQRTFDLLTDARATLPDAARALAVDVLDRRRELDLRLRDVMSGQIDVRRIRCHGDLHLGQVLYTGDDFVFIDFEGEPTRALRERRFKRCPLRDVAGMVRSLELVTEATLRHGRIRPEDQERLAPWARAFSGHLSGLFAETWLDAVRGARLSPHFRADARRLMRFYLLEKCIDEVRHELTHRPDWVRLPLLGLLRLLSPEWA